MLPPSGAAPGTPNPTPGRSAAGQAAPALLTASPTAVSLAKAFCRCWGRALFLGLVCAAGVGSAVWYLLPPAKNTARTLVRIDPVNKFFFQTAPVPNPLEYQ